MSLILLADDSPHAQRMGERILREEGFEVVSLTDGDTVMLRLADVNPDVILADVFLPNQDEGEIITARGVTSAIDLGLCLVERLASAEARTRVAKQMDYPYAWQAAGAPNAI